MVKGCPTVMPSPGAPVWRNHDGAAKEANIRVKTSVHKRSNLITLLSCVVIDRQIVYNQDDRKKNCGKIFESDARFPTHAMGSFWNFCKRSLSCARHVNEHPANAICRLGPWSILEIDGIKNKQQPAGCNFPRSFGFLACAVAAVKMDRICLSTRFLIRPG